MGAIVGQCWSKLATPIGVVGGPTAPVAGLKHVAGKWPDCGPVSSREVPCDCRFRVPNLELLLAFVGPNGLQL